jgi:hypothetical protein
MPVAATPKEPQMPAIHDATSEEALHRSAIATLAEETGRPVPVVKEAYEREYADLKSTARVKDYLALFASKRAKQTLARGHS